MTALRSACLSPRRLLNGPGGRDYSRIYVAHACSTMLLFLLSNEKCGDAVKQTVRDAGYTQVISRFVESAEMIDLIKAKLLVCLAYVSNEDEIEALGKNQRVH